MAGIKFYNRSFCDLSNENVEITITDSTATNNGQDFVDYVRNRKNTSAWMTTGSNDAANTQIDIDLGDAYTFDRILFLVNNFKAYTVQYYNGSSYVDFSSAINETTNTKTNIEHQFDSVTTNLVRIIITGTMTADDEKKLSQLIITKSVGQLSGFPQIRKPVVGKNKKTITMLSGKGHVTTQEGYFSCQLSAVSISNSDDLEIFESLYFANDGLLMWVNAGDDSQFNRLNMGYRGQDIYLVKPTDEYTPEFYEYVYKLGTKIDIKLREVV